MAARASPRSTSRRSEEHTSALQSHSLSLHDALPICPLASWPYAFPPTENLAQVTVFKLTLWLREHHLAQLPADRKSTRLHSSHTVCPYTTLFRSVRSLLGHMHFLQRKIWIKSRFLSSPYGCASITSLNFP